MTCRVSAEADPGLEATYEDLKLDPIRKPGAIKTNLGTTYKDLKHKISSIDVSPLWAYLRGIETEWWSHRPSPDIPGFETTYKDLKQRVDVPAHLGIRRLEATYQALKAKNRLKRFF
jgi:hypothetical protein